MSSFSPWESLRLQGVAPGHAGLERLRGDLREPPCPQVATTPGSGESRKVLDFFLFRSFVFCQLSLGAKGAAG